MSGPYSPRRHAGRLHATGLPTAGQQPRYPPPQQTSYGYPPSRLPPADAGYPPQQRGYLQGGPVDFQSAIKHQFENVLNFDGRASLSAYWYALAAFIVNMSLSLLARDRLGSVAR